MRDVYPDGYRNLLRSGRPFVAMRQTHEHTIAPSHAAVTHSYAALAFYTGGQSLVEQHGKWNLREGDVLLVPAGKPHRIVEVRKPEYWGLAIWVPCLAANAGASLMEPFERVREGGSAVVHIPSARHEYLESLFRELENVGQPEGSHDTLDAVQRSLLTLILVEVERAASWGDTHRTSATGVLVDALRFIERNCLRRLTVEEVAAAVGRSPTYVTTALTQATGRSATRWILSGRMAEARRLLLHSDEMVDIIAERVGYADSTHFIRMFRREHGATPVAWRAAQRRGRSRKGDG